MRGTALSVEEDRVQIGLGGRSLDLVNSEEVRSFDGTGCLVNPEEELKCLNGTLVNPAE